MKTLIVYDSTFGNTKQIALAIGKAFGSNDNVHIIKANNSILEELKQVKLLIVGSPTQRFRPVAAINGFLKNIPKNGLQGVKVAAFDTRLIESEIDKVRILAFFVKIFGYAARPISDKLKKKGGDLIMPPEGFFVEGMEGPLKEGELERAADWANRALELAKDMGQNK